MIGKLMFGPCAIALVSATAVLAQPPQGGSSGDANRLICRSMADTGSRLGHTRACHTAREWTELRRSCRLAARRGSPSGRIRVLRPGPRRMKRKKR